MGSTGGTSEYDDFARARWGAEPAKVSARTDFARDRGRVVHSAALRRLAAKTQVLGPQTDDFVRNRLTHTLEVAQVARDLASQIGCDTDVAETAALAHDLGHPPFGHNGEKALAELADGIGGFEGNAQTLRILTRLEAKFLDDEGRSIGLNLTRATLDASTKYPWVRGDSAKFGVYEDDLPVFAWVRDGVPGGRRCLEAQVMDLSDDIAYSVHDVEDGIVAGRIELVDLADPGLRREVWETARAWYHPGVPDDALEAAWSRLVALPSWPEASYDGSRQALGSLKNLTSSLIGRFCAATTRATQASYGAGPLQRYAADLVVPDDTVLEIGVLKSVAAHLVMEAKERIGVLAAQRDLLADLVDAIRRTGPSVMEPMFQADFAEAPDDDARLRVVVDQVASLTDASAMSWHRHLA